MSNPVLPSYRRAGSSGFGIMTAVGARYGSRGWTLAIVFAVAVLFNYPWELTQAALYVGMNSFSAIWWHCFIASLGDGLLVLLILAVGWVVLRRPDWFMQSGMCGYFLMVAVGLMIGVSVEWVAVHIAGRWAYTARMPLVPRLNVGIAPVAQMLVLPPLIFRVVAAWCGRAGVKSTCGDGSTVR